MLHPLKMNEEKFLFYNLEDSDGGGCVGMSTFLHVRAARTCTDHTQKRQVTMSRKATSESTIANASSRSGKSNATTHAAKMAA